MTFTHRARAVALTVALGALALATWNATDGDRAVALGPRPTLPALVTALAGLVVVATLVWLAVLTGLLLLERTDGPALTGRAACPPALRRALLVLCGVTTAAALALPAQAAPRDDGPSARPEPATSTTESPGAPGTSALLDGLPLPDRPSGRAPLTARPSGPRTAPTPTASTQRPVPTARAGSPGSAGSQARSANPTDPGSRPTPSAIRPTRGSSSPSPSPAGEAVGDGSSTDRSSLADAGSEHAADVADERVTVRPGDTLWGITERQLRGARRAPPSSAATARAWRLVYAANRDVVGPDPDLISPGTTLRVPPSTLEEQP